MNQESENKKKRKNVLLTKAEWLTCFFVPMNFGNKWTKTKTFYNTERERYEKFGFEKKLQQYELARFLGFVFYFIVIGIIFYLI